MCVCVCMGTYAKKANLHLIGINGVQAGGPSYAVELGRLDGLRSTASSVNGRLPPPTFNLDQLTALFAANGLSQADMIALSGQPH